MSRDKDDKQVEKSDPFAETAYALNEKPQPAPEADIPEEIRPLIESNMEIEEQEGKPYEDFYADRDGHRWRTRAVLAEKAYVTLKARAQDVQGSRNLKISEAAEKLMPLYKWAYNQVPREVRLALEELKQALALPANPPAEPDYYSTIYCCDRGCRGHICVLPKGHAGNHEGKSFDDLIAIAAEAFITHSNKKET